MNLPAIIYDLPFADYLAIDAAHFSTLKSIETSPLHYRHAATTERASTGAMLVGKALHRLVLEPRENPMLVVYPGAVRRGKEWETFQREHEGHTILSAAELRRCVAMREAVMKNRHARSILHDETGRAEVSLIWERDGVRMKTRLDWMMSSGLSFAELKTTRKISRRGFKYEAGERTYAAQLAIQQDGLIACGCAALTAYMMAVENEAPHDVRVLHVPEDVLAAGRLQYLGWLARIRECTAADHWPGVDGDAMGELELPDWQMVEGTAPEIAIDDATDGGF